MLLDCLALFARDRLPHLWLRGEGPLLRLLGPASVRYTDASEILKRCVGARIPEAIGRPDQIPALDQLLLKANSLIKGQ